MCSLFQLVTVVLHAETLVTQAVTCLAAAAVVERRTVSALQAAGCPVQLQVLPGKGHAMISSETEMRTCMTFWAKHLKHRLADPNFVEVA